ncbi:hypothetical protein HOLleu_42123 [Holothuria leucospilota]|uniref:G-protein coupled receptors family 1 profile domain-containing protein n=1 Tax=Holothuria leucospilota TaxID=206669 RepID=A0A9Q1BCB4_HOLLE|nr:hypothetical protein HOLleu_42123 [Holothuria leucospilota]
MANLVVILSRIKFKVFAINKFFASTLNTKQNAFLLSLSIADFLMGVYLLCIGIADATFSDAYFLSSHGWRNGIQCKIIGFIGFLSNVASILSLTPVSIERFFTIVLPFRSCSFGSKFTIVICAVIWIISVIMALTPIILSTFVQGIFGFSDICLGLPFVPVPETTENDVTLTYNYWGGIDAVRQTDSKNLQWVYSQIVYIYFSSACVTIITVCYVSMFISITASRMRSGRHGDNKDEIKTAMKMSIIVSTDIICWIPVIIVGILSEVGLKMSINLYAWLAIVVMAINSAFNPLIYTISTMKKKRTGPLFIPDQQEMSVNKAN